jgi:hypothetical protein
MSIGLLAGILQAQGNLGSETKEMHERCLAIYIKHCGSEGINIAVSNYTMGIFYHLRAKGSQTAMIRKENLLLSESKYKESLRIYTKVLGPDNPRTIDALSLFLRIVS